jgi:hypothetical protein
MAPQSHAESRMAPQSHAERRRVTHGAAESRMAPVILCHRKLLIVLYLPIPKQQYKFWESVFLNR